MARLEFAQGETDSIELYITEEEDGVQVPVDLTDSTILFTAKLSLDNSDDKAIIKKDVTVHRDQVTEKGYTDIELTRDDLKKEIGEYFMDIWLVKDGDYTQIYPASKDFVIKSSVSRRD